MYEIKPYFEVPSYLDDLREPPQSLENLVADYTIDGGELTELSFPQIKQLRFDYPVLSKDLTDVGADSTMLDRLRELGQEYGVVETPGKFNLIGTNFQRLRLVEPEDPPTVTSTKSRPANDEIHGPGFGRQAPQILASCARALKKHRVFRVVDDAKVSKDFKYDSKDSPKGKLCTDCPVLKELGHCSVRESFHQMIKEQNAMLHRDRLQLSGGGGGGHSAFLRVWIQYRGSLGGGTPRKPLKVPNIVHI